MLKTFRKSSILGRHHTKFKYRFKGAYFDAHVPGLLRSDQTSEVEELQLGYKIKHKPLRSLDTYFFWHTEVYYDKRTQFKVEDN